MGKRAVLIAFAFVATVWSKEEPQEATAGWPREFYQEGGASLSGPGVNGSTRLSVGDGDAGFWAALGRKNTQYPLGIDVILAGPGQLAAIPRSSKTEV